MLHVLRGGCEVFFWGGEGVRVEKLFYELLAAVKNKENFIQL
jgi:hypothetical protein